jgi:hypothetical protein
MQTREVQASSVPATARQGAEAQSDPRNWTWVEASVWTERMLTALGNGVKGWPNSYFAGLGLFTMHEARIALASQPR